MPHTLRSKKVTKNNKLLYILAYSTSVIGPFFAIPQIYDIIINKNSQGISIITWVGYLGVALIWAWYGIVKKDKLIIFCNVLWAISELLVVTTAFIYK